MRSILGNPWRASLIGLVVGVATLAYVALAADVHAAGTLATRSAHVFAAMVWAGLIVFVNIVQLTALKSVSDAERPVIVRQIAGPTARLFTGAAHATLATGLIMVAQLGADLHHRPLLLMSVLGGLAMWAIVQFILRPNVARVTGKVAAGDAEKAVARAAIATWAPINLIFVIPVTVAMLVAAHAGM